MRIWMTGGTGFVGSNIVHEAVAAGHDVLTTVNSTPPSTLPCRGEPVDMTDGAAVARSVGAARPAVVGHDRRVVTAIPRRRPDFDAPPGRSGALRADRIVAGMLSHARAGTDNARPSDVNALLEESLNLAYHGARAENSSFNVTLERDLDPTVGEVALYPQEITRVFLNLIGNGLYATQKRQTECKEDGYKPTLKVSSRNLGESVEVRVRDNGTGITAEAVERVFEPFFTTKPTGEGTGLGLSLSYETIVQQHRGRLEVDTREGEFTEFTITLPRDSLGNRENEE